MHLNIYIVLAAFALAGLLLYFFKEPYHGVIAIVLLLPLEIVLSAGEASGRITLIKLISISVFARVVLNLFAAKRPIITTPLNAGVLVFLLSWFIPLLIGDSQLATWTLIKDWAWFISLFLIGLYAVDTSEKARLLVLVFVAEMSVIALFGYMQFVFGPAWISQFMSSRLGELLNGPYVETVLQMDISGKSYWTYAPGVARVIGTFFNPDYYAAFLGYPICFALVLSLKGDGLEKKIAIAAFILMLGNLLLTFSRGGWLACVIAVVAILIVVRKMKPALYIAGAMTVIVLFSMMIPQVSERASLLTERAGTFSESFETNPRYDIWKGMLSEISNKPVFGHGEWGFVSTRRFPKGVHAHNLYLEILYATGIVGLIAFIYLMIKAVIGAYGKRLSEGFAGVYAAGYFGALVWFLCHNMVDFQFYHAKNGSIFWLTLGILYGMSAIREMA